MLSSPPLPEPSANPRSFFNNTEHVEDDDDDGADTASQRSIPLSSPTGSPRNSSALHNLARQHHLTSSFRDSGVFSNRSSHPYTDFDDGTSSILHETPSTSAAPSVYGSDHQLDRDLYKGVDLPTYPPSKSNTDDRDRVSLSSLSSQSSRKARPESLLVTLPNGPLILGIALVDFNHLVFVLCGFGV